jgi:hypothetical protein
MGPGGHRRGSGRACGVEGAREHEGERAGRRGRAGPGAGEGLDGPAGSSRPGGILKSGRNGTGAGGWARGPGGRRGPGEVGPALGRASHGGERFGPAATSGPRPARKLAGRRRGERVGERAGRCRGRRACERIQGRQGMRPIMRAGMRGRAGPGAVG